MSLQEVFIWYLSIFLGAVALLWLDMIRRERRREIDERRDTPCPICGHTAHPAQGVFRVRCKNCGFLFESKTNGQ